MTFQSCFLREEVWLEFKAVFINRWNDYSLLVFCSKMKVESFQGLGKYFPSSSFLSSCLFLPLAPSVMLERLTCFFIWGDSMKASYFHISVKRIGAHYKKWMNEWNVLTIMNPSLVSDQVPGNFKDSVIQPLFKNSKFDPSLLGSYRSIPKVFLKTVNNWSFSGRRCSATLSLGVSSNILIVLFLLYLLAFEW